MTAIKHESRGEIISSALKFVAVATEVQQLVEIYARLRHRRKRIGAAVPAVRIELTWVFTQRIAGPPRLPFPPRRHPSR